MSTHPQPPHRRLTGALPEEKLNAIHDASAAAPIICLEGASAVGKTTLARALASTFGAAVVPELDATGAPPAASAEPWFTERHVERWARACALRAGAPLVVIDCDHLKGLWYNWMHAEEGWPGVGVVGPLYRRRMEEGALDWPHLYVFLDATEAELRARRAGDATRRRGGFEKHLAKLRLQRRYFAALREAAPERVAFLDTGDQAPLVQRIAALARTVQEPLPHPVALLDTMADWLQRHSPAQE